MPLVEKRYAEALIGSAIQKKQIDEIFSELSEVVTFFSTIDTFKFFLINPEIKAPVKKTALKKILDNKSNPIILNFIMLLIDKNRISFLPGILDEFKILMDRFKNSINIKIYTAIPLDKKQVSQIEQKYKSMFNALMVNSSVTTDKELLGGIRVLVGDKVFDASIKGKLESLKEHLLAI
jgi:F-type H+-transporting ATPase subunit delta